VFIGELAGRWWLPGDEGRAVPGTLHMDWSQRPRVVTMGPLGEPSTENVLSYFGTRRVHPVVHGRTFDQRVTLLGVQSALRQGHLTSPGDSTLTLDANLGLIGVHVDASSTAFARAEVRVDYLIDFLDRPWIEEVSTFDSHRLLDVKLVMTRDPETTADFPGGKFRAGLDARLEGDRQTERRIVRNARAIVEVDEPVDIETWFAKFIP